MTVEADLLKGVRIVDLTRLLPGPLCTQHLADLGADVIKVEDTHGGDYGRYGLGVSEEDDPNYFDLVNRGKRSIAIDLKHEEGREAFMRLASDAQVLVEGFRPGVMERLGLGFGQIRERNSSIVYCSLSGYGQTGPLHAQAGHDLNYCALTGVTEQTGLPGEDPVIPAFQIADLAGGTLTATTAILAALFKAKSTGRGSHVDVAMTDSVMAHSVFNLAMHRGARGPNMRGSGVLNGGAPCYGVYRAADGKYIALGALEPKFWRRLCTILDRPDLIERHSVTGEAATAVRNELRNIFSTRTREEWMAVLEKADCCASPVLAFDEALEHPHFEARELLYRGASDTADVKGFCFPARIDESSCASARPAPEYGAHTVECLRASGYSDAEIEHLNQIGAVRLG